MTGVPCVDTAFPLEVMGGEATPRAILEQEWWLAALREPRATFEPWHEATPLDRLSPDAEMPGWSASCRCLAMEHREGCVEATRDSFERAVQLGV